MPLSKNSRPLPKKKPLAKKRWKAAPSKRSATSATKPKSASGEPRPKKARAKLRIVRDVELKADVNLVLELLERAYPDAHCELAHRNPFELLIATVLSAQCTDVMVNRATPALFEAYPDAASLADSDPADVEAKLRMLNLYRTKAKNIRLLARALRDKHGGEVPRTVEELVELAGVGRKTANVVLGNAFNIASGIVVDTHVGRLSRRFGWTREEDAVRIEKDLVKIIPQERWVRFSHELIFHGRRHCKALRPECGTCVMTDVCPRIGVPADEKKYDRK